ncbi:hypothetical protein LJR010_001762 [Ensifer adhaerens]|uniref:hypothetical protein n=1 Tax=Ensifer adhaerens TaxID=106592 RepID=UPI00399C3D08
MTTATNAFDEGGVLEPMAENVIINIQSSVIGSDVLHYLTFADGRTDEAWGLEGIEGLVNKYLVGDEGTPHPDIALHFYRKMHEIIHGEYTMSVGIDNESDVVNIRIARPGMEDLHYPNRFILFESNGWWLEPEQRSTEAS